MTQAITIRDVLAAKKLHLASEVHAGLSPHTITNWLISYQATVIAVGILAENPHLYGAQPFVISGMDKTEDVPSQTKLIGMAMKAVSLKSKDIHSILYNIASDRDSRQRLTAVKLTMKTTILQTCHYGQYLEISSSLTMNVGKMKKLWTSNTSTSSNTYGTLSSMPNAPPSMVSF